LSATDILDAPPAELRFRRRVRMGPALSELWRARELVRTLAEREIRARYKQSLLGFAWAIIPPVGLLLVFSVFFRRVGDVHTEGAPYQLYVYLGLIPWTFFSTAVLVGGQSLLNNLALLNKVYCPREVFPLAAIITAGIDGLMSTLVLLVLFPLDGVWPAATSVWVPLLLLVQLAFTTGVVLAISAVVIYVRDVRHALPLLVQFGLFATPVAYSIRAIGEGVRPLYAALNPLGPVIDGYRRTVLLGLAPEGGLLAIGAASSLVVLTGGYLLFKRLETGIADVA
jgi:ABC-type polysaccharide/polyol phosphate export permease